MIHKTVLLLSEYLSKCVDENKYVIMTSVNHISHLTLHPFVLKVLYFLLLQFVYALHPLNYERLSKITSTKQTWLMHVIIFNYAWTLTMALTVTYVIYFLLIKICPESYTYIYMGIYIL